MIKLITGPMKSGKSDVLIAHLEKADREGAIVRAYKPAVDTRDESIVSRTGKAWLCDIISSKNIELFSFEINELIYAAMNGERVVVAFDEFQFFHDEIILDCIDSLDLANVEIIISGLDFTSEKKPFGFIPDIKDIIGIGTPDTLIELKADCDVCGGKNIATFSKANFEKNSDIAIGDEEYLAVCENCY